MALSYDIVAAHEFFETISNYIKNAKPWDGGIILHTVTPDESSDLTVMSRRVYGRSCEYLAIMASAGISHFDDVIKSGTVIYLPNDVVLSAIKRKTGYESDETMIEDGKPIWFYS